MLIGANNSILQRLCCCQALCRFPPASDEAVQNVSFRLRLVNIWTTAQVCAIAAFLACPQAAADTGVVRLEGGAVAESFVLVLKELDRKKLLPRRLVSDRQYSNPGSLFATKSGLSERAQLPGGGVSYSLDQFLCELNVHNCRSGRSGPLWAYEPAATEKTASDKQGCEEKPAFYQLCIPEIQISTYCANLLYNYNPRIRGERSINAIIRDAGTCLGTPEETRKFVDSLNNLDRTNQLYVPTNAFRIQFALPDGFSEEQIKEVRVHIIESLTQNSSFSGDFERVASQIQIYSVPSERLKPRSQSTGWNDTVGTNGAVRGTVHFDEEFETALAPPEKNEVVFIYEAGGQIDRNHCDFRKPEELGDCQPHEEILRPIDEQNRDDDELVLGHPTQVAGVLAALRNSWGTVGLYSGIAVEQVALFDEITPGKDSVPSPIDLAQQNWLKTRQAPPPLWIINFSVDLAAETRCENCAPEELARQAHAKNFLIVAAAGNYGKNADTFDKCLVTPACYGAKREGDGRQTFDNIISVVAVAPPTTPAEELSVIDKTTVAGCERSNNGPIYDVAAPGLVRAPLPGKVGTHKALSDFCGTSAATPVVTALAARIAAEARRKQIQPGSVTPARVRERILSTTTLNDAVLKITRFGLVDYERALTDMTMDRVKKCGDPIGAVKLTIPQKKRMVRLVRNTAAETTPLVNVRRLFRSSCDDGADDVVIFNAVIRTSRGLERDLVRIKADYELYPGDPNNSVQGIDIKAVQEFIQCSFTERCEPPL